MVELHYQDVDSISYLSRININSWFIKVAGVFSKQLGDVNIIFCSDEFLLNMNIEHLKHDYYTDIITFDYCEYDTVSGDLFISLDRVKENASDLSVLFSVELNRVMVHGFLHLCGFADKSEEESSLMRKHEDEMLLLL